MYAGNWARLKKGSETILMKPLRTMKIRKHMKVTERATAKDVIVTVTMTVIVFVSVTDCV